MAATESEEIGSIASVGARGRTYLYLKGRKFQMDKWQN